MDVAPVQPTDSPQTLPEALGRLRVALDDAFVRASRDVGLTPQQAELLCAAMGAGGIGNLAQTLRCDRSNVSRLVDRAAAHGLLTRRAGDRDGRVTLVDLTARGELLTRRFLSALESQTKELRARWSADRRQLAVDLLNEISNDLDSPTRPLKEQRRPKGARPRDRQLSKPTSTMRSRVRPVAVGPGDHVPPAGTRRTQGSVKEDRQRSS